MNQSDKIDQLAVALCNCQSQIKPALKDTKNEYFKSKYADLSSVWAVCREPLSENGLCVIQTIDRGAEGEPILVTTLAHISGQWIKSTAPIPIKEEVGQIDPKKRAFKNDPQALGSSITYMRRYALSAIVGISTEDDDGEAAMNRVSKKPKTENISEVQFKTLISIIPKCDDEYLTKLYSYLNNVGIDGIANIPAIMFDKVFTGLNKNAEANAKKEAVNV